MKRGMWIRLLSITLVVGVIASVVPGSVFADAIAGLDSNAVSVVETLEPEQTEEEVQELPGEDAVLPSTEPQVSAEPEATAEPQASAEPEATVEPQASAEPEATAEPQASAEPQTSAEPEATAEPQTSAEPEATAEPQTSAEPEATVKPQPMCTLVPAVTPAPSEKPEESPAPEATEEPIQLNEKEYIAVANTENGVTVEVTVPEGALPQEAQLKVEMLTNENEGYAEAEAVLNEQNVEADGFAVLDIYFEYNGEEVEPLHPVGVKINAVGILEENTDPDTVVIQHLKEDEINNTTKVEVVASAAESADQAAESTEGSVSVEGEQLVAKFSVESFSKFVIYWAYSGMNTTTVKYVDENNNEIDVIDAQGDLTVNESNWNTISLNSIIREAVGAYQYDHAEILFSAYEPRERIKDIRVSNRRNGYLLQCTPNGKDWDSVGQTAVIYLIYKRQQQEIKIIDDVMNTGSLKVELAENMSSDDVREYHWFVAATETGRYQPVEAYSPTEPILHGYSGFEDGKDSLFVARAGARKWFKVQIVTNDGEVIESSPFQVSYYDELQNGTFETPHVGPGTPGFQVFQDTWFVQALNGTEGLHWKTTGSDQKVEIAEPTTNRNNVYNTIHSTQFAELNCESIGALYQDVLTEPGTTLYWSLWHSGRNYKNETMQVMISGAKGLEPDWNPAGQIYPDDQVEATIIDGVNSWNYYASSGEGYKVPEGQYITRFYFISSGAGLNDTHGNLLDDIGFGRNVPKPKPKTGSLVIDKTVTGIEKGTVIPANAFTFDVKNCNGEVIQTVQLPSEDTIAKGTLEEFKYVITDVTAGDYIVTERIPPVIQDHTLVAINGIRDPEKAVDVETTVAQEKTVSVKFENAYMVNKTTLTLQKTFEGLSDAQIEALSDTLVFNVINEKGTKQTVSLAQMEKQPDGSYQYVINGIRCGIYTVEEMGADVEKYHRTTTCVVNGKSFLEESHEVNLESAPGTVAFHNVYTKTVGSLTIEKKVSEWNAEKGKTATFVFEIKENTANGKTYYQTITLNKTNPKGSVTIQLPAGSYTVSELQNAGYKLQSCNPADGTVLVGEGNAVVSFVNADNGNKNPGDQEYADNQFSWDSQNGWLWKRADQSAK